MTSQIPLLKMTIVGPLPWGSTGHDKGENPVNSYAAATDRRRARLRVPGRDLAEAVVGRGGEAHRGAAGRGCWERRIPGNPGRGRGHAGGPGALAVVPAVLRQAAAIVREGIEETRSYRAFPREHWTRMRTNHMLERIMREIRRRTRVVGNFPDGQSAVMLVAARLRHVAGTRWGSRPYLDMARLREEDQEEQAVKAG